MDNEDRIIQDLQNRVSALEQTVYAASPHQQEGVQQAPVSQAVPPYGPSPQPHPNNPYEHPQGAPVAAKQQNKPKLTSKHILILLGSIITLFGFSFIILLSIANNWLTPELRVILLFLISTALIYGGITARKKNKSQHLSTSLALTGTSGYYLTILSMHNVYHWVNLPIALILCLLVSFIGHYLTYKWSTKTAIITNTLGVIITTLIIFREVPEPNYNLNYVIPLYLFVLFLVNNFITLKNKWDILWGVNIFFGSLLSGFSARIMMDYKEMAEMGVPSLPKNFYEMPLFANLIAYSMLAVILALSYLYKNTQTKMIIVIPLITFISITQKFDSQVIWAILFVASLALIGLYFIDRKKEHNITNILAVFAALYQYLAIVDFNTMRYNRTPSIAGVDTYSFEKELLASNNNLMLLISGALLIASIIGYLGLNKHNRFMQIYSLSFILISFFTYLGTIDLSSFFSKYEAIENANIQRILFTLAMGTSMILAAVIIQTIGKNNENLHIKILKLVQQFSIVTVLITFALVIIFTAVIISHDNGFYYGHLLTTVIWFAAATYMMYSENNGKYWSDKLAINILIVSTVKLFLFDLSTLDGVIRAVLFILVGLSILAVSYIKIKTMKLN